jgi:hypothetical protein
VIQRRFLARWQAAAWRGRFCIVAVAALVASDAGAQARRVTGRVLRPAGESMRGVEGAWVVLHRVSTERSGPLDSARTARDGGFVIRYTPSGSDNAIYFVSATHDGIAYFSPPLDTARAVDGAELAVFDTTSAPVPIHVRGRHVVVAASEDDGTREIVEVYELANDSSLTRVAAGNVPVWSAVLPDGASDIRIGQSDLSDDAVRTDSGRVRVYAPLAPGIKQLSYAYRVHARTFPLSLPVEAQGGVLEVLLEEPNASASAPGLERVDPVTVESRTFNRFLAQEVAQGGVLRIDVPRAAFVARRAWVVAMIASIAAAMMLVLLRAARAAQRAPAKRANGISIRPKTPPERPVQRLAREIAALDARVENAPHLSDDDRAAYARRRAVLKSELASALDAERKQR